MNDSEKPPRVPRPPPPTSETVSIVMRSNKARDTKPEMLLRKSLCSEGMSGYRLSIKGIPGRPDICYPGRRLAIFVHGCFWHRCPRCDLPLPKSNREYWVSKFETNVERDRRKRLELEEKGWRVMEIWECEINDNLQSVIERIRIEHVR